MSATTTNILEVNDATFSDVVEKSDRLTVVDFWATWCGPCRLIAPLLEDLAVRYADTVRIAKLDIDQNVRTTTRYNIRSAPTLLFFKNGELVDRVIGAVPKARIEQIIAALQ
jgi:thioredoxin 1